MEIAEILEKCRDRDEWKHEWTHKEEPDGSYSLWDGKTCVAAGLGWGDAAEILRDRGINPIHQKMLVIAIRGLEEIAKNMFCFGPGCTYCETGEHPPSHEAIQATATLKAIKEVA